jgi:cold shock CspA family protein
MVTGKVVRFDRGRGYGFIAPDPGGDDVFVHANDLEASGVLVACGTRVQFEMVDGGRGPKAYDVKVLTDGDASPETAAPEQQRPAQTATVSDEECEILSEREFVGELTEVLLTSVPTLTAGQLLEVRKALTGLARSHGWVD